MKGVDPLVPYRRSDHVLWEVFGEKYGVEPRTFRPGFCRFQVCDMGAVVNRGVLDSAYDGVESLRSYRSRLQMEAGGYFRRKF